MPRLNLCAYPGCNVAVRRPERRCAKHKAIHEQRQRGRLKERQADDARPNAADRGYDSHWRKLRLRILAAHPVCQYCGREPATEVHHVQRLAEGGSHDPENLRALCRACHARRGGR